jgi:hypothetical protein
MKEEGVLTMVISGGLFLIGRLVGGNKLVKPRVFQVIENGKRIQMSPLPGTPPFMRIGLETGSYAIPEREKEIHDLYERVANPNVDPGV